jgi:MoaA/NifB/PqqE/SkfB family radical SAM enzyme
MKPSHAMWTGIRIAGYKFGRKLGWPLPMPVNLAMSVTERCNSRCKTCNVWKGSPKNELSVREWEMIFKSIGRTHSWITVAEGEAFISDDLVDIMRTVVENNDPQILLFPTNGILTKRIEESVREILKFFKGRLIVNFSLDGVGSLHDSIRGKRGNFKSVIEGVYALKGLKAQSGNLSVGINTVVSKYNIGHLKELSDFVAKELHPDSHVFEIARTGESLYNIGMDVGPGRESYLNAMNNFSGNGENSLTSFFRNRYYNLLEESLVKNEEVVPCYSGISSGHISSRGDVWACSMKCEVMGNLRKSNYDFRKVWKSRQASLVRRGIKERRCWCTMANVSYTNMLCSPSRLFRK